MNKQKKILIGAILARYEKTTSYSLNWKENENVATKFRVPGLDRRKRREKPPGFSPISCGRDMATCPECKFPGAN